MRSAGRYVALVAVMLLMAPLMGQAQFRGLGRVTGSVTDESGSPVKDVVVRATLSGVEGTLEERSDERGAWVLNGMAKGEWHLVFQIAGYVPVGAKVNMTAELSHIPPITVVLKKVGR